MTVQATTKIVQEQAPRTLTSRGGLVTAWAALGAAWVAFVCYGWIRWGLSKDARTVAIQGPDHYPTTKLVVLRLLEVSSLGFVAFMFVQYLVRPWVRERRLGLEGRLLIGGAFGFFLDPVVNLFKYTFAWNQHAINLGTWVNVFPGVNKSVGQDGEGLLWAFPQYIMIGTGAAVGGATIVAALRKRWPEISITTACAAVFAAFFVADAAIESLFLWAQVYEYPRTWKALTIFAGRTYQFPIYESVLIGVQAVALTLLMLSARESSDGLAYIERGIDRLRPVLRSSVRTLAVIGFCYVIYAFGWFFPQSWMSISANSIAHLPSYLLPQH